MNVGSLSLKVNILPRDAQYWTFADIRYAYIFQLRPDTDIFPFVWKQYQVSPVQKLSKIFLILVSF